MGKQKKPSQHEALKRGHTTSNAGLLAIAQQLSDKFHGNESRLVRLWSTSSLKAKTGAQVALKNWD